MTLYCLEFNTIAEFQLEKLNNDFYNKELIETVKNRSFHIRKLVIYNTTSNVTFCLIHCFISTFHDHCMIYSV